ncbi:MAG: toxin-antitoxin system YwqK family antitoxin [Bacteroidales bacterium]|jgi:antitoxin component YwqK of YwqJK toxin-antitoxin module|nr:toxin-antitoxin system YwqK family antitoxin [Bacteroidales bacterium]MDI9576140.1 toxin-antitoxin system YwqK family antitoxin [Bacteroidota bacterium]MDD3756138.1 toxin-antitoxin system YwqK family antitoxin [Bacteroidales bacterium]MDY0401388.1 toxin-antitoxin system YwqK family antitoxin [Bacteroidales bacterium]HHW59601.1 toxin-antitoxin system YwqK family antitoxin [Bacteroidales bacterium]
MNQNKIIYFLIVLFLIIGCKKVEKVYYPDGSLAAEYSIKNNKKEGIAYQYDKMGNKIAEMNYKNDFLDGFYYEYYPNGTIKSKIEYKENKKNGKAFYYDLKGNIVEELTYKNDTLNGIYKEYYSNTLIKKEGNYKNGKYDGAWYYYNEKGYLTGEGHFDNGNGELVSYYPYSDIIHSVTPFINNQKNGWEVVLSPNGDTLLKNYYENDIKI